MAGLRLCEYCKEEFPSDMDHCPNCGAEYPQIQTAPATYQQSATYVQPLPKQESESQALSITAFVLALIGLAVVITFIPALIIGLVALRKEPKGKVYAWIAVGGSAGILLIVVVLVITAVIQIAAAPKPWY